MMQKTACTSIAQEKRTRLLDRCRHLSMSSVNSGKCVAPCRRARWIAHSTARPRLSTAAAPSPVARCDTGGATRVPLGSLHVTTDAHLKASVASGLEAYRQNRAAKVVDRREAVNRTSADISIQGYFGEFMLARLFGMSMKPLLEPSCRSGLTEKGFDGTLRPEMWRIDVKVSNADTGKLRVGARKGANRPDLYALFVYVNYEAGKPLDSPDLPAPVLRFEGFVPAGVVFDPRYLSRDGSAYWVPTDRLVSREALWAMVESGHSTGLRRYAARP
ncbi:hypothetical protein pneo_cds_253 [Pandoravirus neocaledonia]|uniref:Uncharacterized protein n=1 Tax=Pandoravirus neocaledonia TaxID=2107708 RepID=A0A2U7UC08_9VIRU|nr:hypothetical protein pneo_cds_253 [Pandoravirus neocaledonia]AVK75860.1 hypothetical protein pneo_cds_253 [Pandoravirus neocaledonia]